MKPKPLAALPVRAGPRWLSAWGMARLGPMGPRRRLSRRRRLAALWVAALCSGVLAAWSAHRHLAAREAWLIEQSRTVTVQRVVAARDLSAGMVLSADALAVRAVPADVAPSDSLAPSAHTQLLGARLRQGVRAGDLLLPLHVAQVDTHAFSDTLAAGRRAVTLPLDTLNLSAGLLRPGDRIDLYVSFDHQQRRVTAPLMQAVRVLATGTRAQREDDWSTAAAAGYATVTLDASPDDAVKLVAARQGGTLTAVLRAPDDVQELRKGMRGDLSVLLGVAEGAAPPARPQVPVLYGNATRLVTERAVEPARVPSLGWFDLPDHNEVR